MIVWHVVEGSLMITAFVGMMMLGIEYLNVLSGGAWFNRLTSSRAGQYVVCALLGALPGCLGAFAVVSLFSHKRVTLGALVATMIATSGDEAFVMLAVFPKTAVAMSAGMVVLGIAAGALTDFVCKGVNTGEDRSCDFLTIHHEWDGAAFPRGQLLKQWKHLSAIRGILTGAIAIFILLMIGYKFGLFEAGEIFETTVEAGHDLGGAHEHNHVGWEWYTLLGLSAFGLFIISTVSDHFLDEHLWKHVLRSHIPRIFLWTLGTLTAIAALKHFVDIDSIVEGNIWLVLAIAVLIGMIPDSGPHLIFVSLYAAGTVPLSILVASSIVQDGHGMVPVLAHSRRDFMLVKAINVVVGLAVGAAMLAAGW